MKEKILYVLNIAKLTTMTETLSPAVLPQQQPPPPSPQRPTGNPGSTHLSWEQSASETGAKKCCDQDASPSWDKNTLYTEVVAGAKWFTPSEETRLAGSDGYRCSAYLVEINSMNKNK